MTQPKLPELDYSKLEIGEELGTYEYVLTQAMIDEYRKSVDDPEGAFPTIAVKHDATALGLAYEDNTGGVNAGNEIRMISNEEFTTREDGLITFEETYGFEIARENIESLPGAVTAQAQQTLASGEGDYDLAVAYGTDGTLATFDLVVFADPLGAQPVYQPTPVFRGEVIRANPEIATILNPIFATFDVATLQEWNSYAAEGINMAGENVSVEDLAREYLETNGFIDAM